jgi:hypothetical protein
MPERDWRAVIRNLIVREEEEEEEEEACIMALSLGVLVRGAKLKL